MNSASSLFVLTAVSSIMCACGSTATPEPRAAEPAVTSTDVGPTKADGDKSGTIAISDDLRKACGINDSEAYFAFNSAQVRNSDKQVITKLRDCFVSGAMKGRSMQLVGHADPRGDDNYNLALGGSRADSVKQIVVNEGMPESRVLTSSRGEMDATGTNEPTWAKDRRVDVLSGN